MLVIGSADTDLLQRAGEAAAKRVELLGLWPAQLHASLPAACDTLADDPDMLELLTSELSASHVPQLINHADNADRVAAQLTSKVSVKSLIDQLSELRANLTESSDGVTTGFVGDGEGEGGEGGGPSRVRRCATTEEWYDGPPGGARPMGPHHPLTPRPL